MANEKKSFDITILYAKHLCSLYELVHDSREVEFNPEAEDSLKKYFKLNETDSLLQIRGSGEGDQRSLLLINNPSKGMTTREFKHEYASPLLRSAIVSAVAALDNYMHLVVVNKCFTLLRGPRAKVPKPLLKLEVPAIAAFETAEKLRKSPSSKPGYRLKELIRDKFGSQTMQGSGQIYTAVKLMGVKDIWTRVETEMKGTLNAADIQMKLNQIVDRRNKITHEADIIRQSRGVNRNFAKINKSDAESAVAFITDFVTALDAIFYP